MSATRYHFDVTQEDIDNATRGNSNTCAVATAIQRALPNASRVMVDMQSIRFTLDGKRRLVYLTPVNPQEYIIAFDAGDVIKPFSFSVQRPAWKGEVVNHRVQHYEAQVMVGTRRTDAPGGGRVVTAPDHLPRSDHKRSYGVRRMRSNRQVAS